MARGYSDPDANLWRTTPADAPLVIKRPHYFDSDEFEALRACALDHPKLAEGNNPLTGAFKGTSGVFTQFTHAGYSELIADPKLACFAPFVDVVRNETDANVFVMNVVSASPGTDTAVITWHIDQSIGLNYIPPAGW